ncbi:hypothetical protein [Micromonospora sp. NPDC023737]|uniref:hypothetical protein n=1 Tax=unclassified Micromonospora TaxID=2617518 RepID=UPI0033F55F0F
MAFPDDQVATEVDLYLGDTLGWVNVLDAGHVRHSVADSGGGITITRGRPNEGREPDLTQCNLVLNNKGGRYSPRNPNSPYYGLLGRNTPIRVRVGDLGAAGAVALTGPAKTPSAVTTPAHTSLNAAGDLDIRIWVRLVRWATGSVFELVGKYWATGTERGWAIDVDGVGVPALLWSPDGTLASRITRRASEPVVSPDGGPLALRVTLTRATGVVRFYTAPSLAGPWVQLGTDASPAGATSVAASPNAGIELGSFGGLTDQPAAGELYGFELRIGGTLVCSPDFTQMQPGQTALTDAQGRTWTLAGSAVAIDRAARFYGEVSSWPSRWNAAGTDQWVPVDAAGITRRLSQSTAVTSPLRRTLTAVDPAGYLPLEEGTDATRPTPATQRPTTATSTGVTYGEEQGRLPGSRSVAKLTASSSITTTVTPRPGSQEHSLLAFLKLAEMPAGGDQTYLRVYWSGGTVARWDFQMSGGGYRWIGYDGSGDVVSDHNFNNANHPPTDWLIMYVEWSVSGGTVTLHPWVANAGDSTFSNASWTYTGTLGYPTRVEVVGNSDLQDALLSHLAVNDSPILLSADFAAISTAYTGEKAGERIARVCGEAGIPITFWGAPDDTTVCGPQPIVPLLDALRDAAAADGGILLDARGHRGLHYRTRSSLYNQTPIELDYTHLSAPFEPTDDDDATSNDITVTRPDGASSQAVQLDGPLSVLDPPTGVGRYSTSETINVAGDHQLPDLAGWLLHLGTVDEARYPRIRLNLAGTLADDQALTRQVVLADAGDTAAIGGLPVWLPPGPAGVVVQGYTETIDGYDWSITWNASPSSPWDVATVDGDRRVAADGSALATGLSGTSLLLGSSLDNGAWTQDPGDFPLDIRVGAERVVSDGLRGSDGFDRTVSGGWGTDPTTGLTWAVSGGTGAQYGVASGGAWHDVEVINETRRTRLPVSLLDVEVLALVASNKLATGGNQECSPMLRIDPNDIGGTYYYTEVEFSTTQTVRARIVRRQGGVDTPLTTAFDIPGLTHAANRVFRVRSSAVGDLIRMKVWRDGTDEPSAWTVSVVDTAPLLTPGQVGLRSTLDPPNTNVLPVRFMCWHFSVTGSGIAPAIVDTFTRSTSNGWGTADTGQSWTTVGTASDYAVAGGSGRHIHTNVSTLRQSYIAPGGSRNFTHVFDIQIPVMPAGGGISVWAVVREADTSNYYAAQLLVAPGGAATLAWFKRVGGSLSALTSTTSVGTHTSGAWWRVSAAMYGTSLHAKAWIPASAEEPSWQVIANDTALAAGTQVGILSRLESGNTNTLPVTLFVDNFVVTNPQTVTLSARGVNGITKTWSAGTEVDVWQPAAAAL